MDNAYKSAIKKIVRDRNSLALCILYFKLTCCTHTPLNVERKDKDMSVSNYLNRFRGLPPVDRTCHFHQYCLQKFNGMLAKPYFSK